MNVPSQLSDHGFLASAAACFAACGYDATSIARIADCTGLSEAAICGIYGNKSNLFLAVFDWYFPRMLMARIQKHEAERSPTEAILAVLEEATAASLSQEPYTPYRLLQVALEASVSSTVARKAVSAALCEIEAFFYRCILASQHSGHLRNTQRAEDLAKLVLGVLVSTGLLVSISPGLSSIEDVMRPILAMLRETGN
jgi:TetR/AcrR family transcriptional repressor of nem operon